MCLVVIIVLNPPQEIEEAHHNLLKTLSDPPNQESEDQQCLSATVSRTPSLERGSINGATENKFIYPLNNPVTPSFPFDPHRQRGQHNGTQGPVHGILTRLQGRPRRLRLRCQHKDVPELSRSSPRRTGAVALFIFCFLFVTLQFLRVSTAPASRYRRMKSLEKSWKSRKREQNRVFCEAEELSEGREQESVTMYKRGNIRGIPHPRTLPTMLPPFMCYSSVDRSGTRVSTAHPPPGPPFQCSNGCFTLISPALMAEGLCLI